MLENNISYYIEILSSMVTWVFPVILGILFWFGITNFIAKYGWNKIAERYPDYDSESKGEKISFQTVQINNKINYGGSVTFEARPEGLHMRMTLPLFLGHKKILIPWGEIEIKENNNLKKYAHKYIMILHSLSGLQVNLPKKVGDWIKKYI